MDKAIMKDCNLRQKSKYCDLEIECEGTSFYVHRVMGCEKSEVLARECDAKASTAVKLDQPQMLTVSTKRGPATAIRHTIFDADTLERMLQFMYRGDCTVPMSDGILVSNGGDVADHTQSTAATKSTAPHLSRADSGTVPWGQRNTTSPYGPVVSHGYVYAIAGYYKLADLKTIALRKFKESETAMTLHDFVTVTRVAYRRKFDAEDELRRELLSMLINKHIDWLTDRRFAKALESHVELHAFSVGVTSAMSERFLDKIATLQTEVETQHTSNVQLHGSLNQAIHDRAEANAQIMKLQKDLENHHEAVSRSEEQLKICESLGRENFEKADNNQKAVRERDELLEIEKAHADRASLLLVQKCEEIEEKDEKIRARDEKLADKDLKIKEETSRANQNHEMCKQRDQLIRQKDKSIMEKDKTIKGKDDQIKKETARANKNYEACMQKDYKLKEVQVNEQAIKEERARGNRGFRHFHQAQNLINPFHQCRDCGWASFPLLYKDGSKTVYIRCRQCGEERYAEHVD